ncbi:2-oxo-4-hydroxy-4-carboxy-5-ureidoimidazoline decarboxylase [Embleya scabrispora]|uniref:2-oxo-4-hydroxy-4-carboxy-5-ureidoimidazoline decarboxylase n=1 Tax=Embleya scabrispora TaxID=159449 RepID=UPI0003828038|nr:2-oxo-4-hydroxy-4-carboxy-5-ureidoimidazoline decarboxylase [Embleya scabrispora]MYS82903.1 2-oxo-4-hydroxy-4-carboxy-5-ureidoimidazoline decarboxylase [Streptomyces sp. SID5474]
MSSAPGLDRLNDASADEAIRLLGEVCASGAWIGAVLVARPYGDPDELYACSDRAVAALTADDLREAIDGHAVIGRPRHDDPQSAREQSGVHQAGDAVLADLRAGNIAYRNRFGRVFLICASGRSAAEMLAELRHRLDNDPASEWEVTREELRKINRLRLKGLISA